MKYLTKSFLSIILFMVIEFFCMLVFFTFYGNGISTSKTYLFTIINTTFFGVALFIGFSNSNILIKKTIKESNLNSILYTLLQSSANNKEAEQLYHDILNAAVEAIPTANKGSIMLLDISLNRLKFVAATGHDEELLKDTFLKIEQSFVYMKTNGKNDSPVIVDNPYAFNCNKFDDENISKILAATSETMLTTLSAPIILNGELYGMINVDSTLKNAFDKTDIKIIQVFAYEITNVIRLYESLKTNTYLSNHDILTGLYNRSFFNQFLQQILHENNFENFKIISIDLNNLKKTNDTFGHLAGDELLVQFAKSFSKFICDDCCLARYGGDEFLLLVPNTTDAYVEKIIFRAIKWNQENPIVYEGNEIMVDFSYGIASYPQDSEVIDKLLQVADDRMYQYKREHHLLHSDKV